MVYAVFTTPENSIPGSAVCAFKLSDLAVAFEKGPFKGQSGPDANWLPVSHSQVYILNKRPLDSYACPDQCIGNRTN